MYCYKCGKLNDDDAKFCTGCGTAMMKPQEAAAGQAAPAREPEPQQASKNSEPEAKGKESVLGIIALVCAFVFPLIGLILGIVDFNTKDGYGKTMAKWAMIAAGVMLVLRVIGAIVGSIFAQIITKNVFEMFKFFM